MNIATMTADEIRIELKEKYGYTDEQVSEIKGKNNLAITLKKEVDAESQDKDGFFAQIPIEKPSVESRVNNEEVQERQTKSVEMGSREWEDYVFSLLYPNEFEEKDGVKYPKSSGLRRLTQKLIGPIVKSGPVSVTQIDNESATVIYELHVLYNNINVTNANQYIREDDLTASSLRVYSAAANVYRGNTPDTFAVHSVATAETRAEGRALKRALSLSTYTAEEMNNDKDVQSVFENKVKSTESKIKSTQITAITTLCGRLGIDVHKFTANQFPEHLVFDDTLSYERASKLMVVLNKYQAKDSTSLTIPEEIKIKLD